MALTQGNDRGAENESGAEVEGEQGGSFSLVLEFAAVECPGCGKPGEPGSCPECGSEIPATSARSEATKARIKAVGPLAGDAASLVREFGQLPEGNIPLSNDQFTHALIDADIFGLLQEMTTLGNELELLDLNDSDVIGRDLRRIVDSRLNRVRKLLDVCRELALFKPAGPAEELRAVSVDAGRYGAQLIEACISVLVASTIAEAREAEQHLQQLLDNIPFAGRFSEALKQVEAWMRPDIHARVGLVLGREGIYTDDFGFLDLGRIFGAFADHGNPFDALAAQSRSYFGHLLGRGAHQEPGFDALLALPAVALATLDRPLLAHRIAHALHELMTAAWADDPARVQSLIDRTIAQGPLLFAAAARIERGFTLLAAGEASGLVDDESVIKTVMDTYEALAETSFRTYGWLARDLTAVVGGIAAEEGDQAPTVGPLEDQLASSGSRIGEALAASSDSALRNASAHEQYRWDEKSETLRDLRTGQVWSLEELERSVFGLVGAAIGADAGYSCFLASGEVELEVPEWLTSGEAPHAIAILAEASFGAFGFDVLAVHDNGATVVIKTPDHLDKSRLMPPLGGMSAILGEVETFRVYGQDGRALLDVAGEAMVVAREAGEPVRDLAALAPLLSDGERSGHDPHEALMRVLAVQVAQVVLAALKAVEAPDAGPHTAQLVGDRLNFVIRFAQQRSDRDDREVRRLIKRLGRASAAAFATAQGVPGAADRLGPQLVGLVQWAQSRGISWPPF